MFTDSETMISLVETQMTFNSCQNSHPFFCSVPYYSRLFFLYIPSIIYIAQPHVQVR